MEIQSFLSIITLVTVLLAVGFILKLAVKMGDLLNTRFHIFTMHMDKFIDEIERALVSTNTNVNKLFAAQHEKICSNTEIETRLIESQLKMADLERDRSSLIEENRQLAALLEKFKTVDYSDQVENAAPEEPRHVDLDGMFEVVLTQLGNPASVYEAGVYNGVVAIANTLGVIDFAPCQIPTTKHTMPSRDAKGRFLPTK